MTDRVYPSATKPPTAAPTKTHLYNPTRHPYRPNPPPKTRRTHRRIHLCCCCFWSLLIIFILLIAATLAAAVAYSIYKPHYPTFAFTSLKLSHLNLTTASDDDSTTLTTKLNITLSSTNFNKKLIFIYDPIQITALSTREVEIARGSFKSFVSAPKNVTYIHTPLYSTSQVLDAASVKSLRSDLKKKSGVPLKILLDTKVVVKADNVKSEKIGIRIKCEGVHAVAPKGKSVSTSSVSKAKCRVDLRMKIWKWTF